MHVNIHDGMAAEHLHGPDDISLQIDDGLHGQSQLTFTANGTTVQPNAAGVTLGAGTTTSRASLGQSLRPGPGSDGQSALLSMPDESIVNILSFLTAPDVSKTTAVCKALKDKCVSDAIWFSLFVADFDVSQTDLPSLRVNPRLAYLNRLQMRTRRLRQVTERRQQEQIQVEAADRQARLGCCLSVYSITSWLAVPAPLGMIFLILVGVNLDDQNNWSWPAIFSPLWILLALLSISVCITGFLYWKRKRRFGIGLSELSPWHRQWERLGWTPPNLAVRLAFLDNPGAVWHGCSLAFVLLLAPVLIAMKAGGVGGSDYNWATAFIPIWVAVVLLPVALCTRGNVGTDREARTVFSVIFMTLVLPFLAVMITLAVSLDNGLSIPLHLVFIPFWIIDGIVALVMLCHCGFATFRFTVARDCEDCAVFLFTTLTLAAVLLPPFLTLLLLCLKVDGGDDISWKSILGPMWFWLLVGIIASWIATCNACVMAVCRPAVERRRQLAASQDPFGAEAAAATVGAALPALRGVRTTSRV